MLILQQARRAPIRDETVCALAFTPDGTLLASGMGYMSKRQTTEETWTDPNGQSIRIHRRPAAKSCGQVKLWDWMQGKERTTLLECSNFVRAVAFSPDGKTLAVGSGDHQVLLWDIAAGTQSRALKGHTRVVAKMAFSPDGTALATGSADQYGKHKGGEVILWNLFTGEPHHVLPQPQGAWSVAFSPDGKTLAVGTATSVDLWDIATAQLWATLPHRGTVRSLVFTPDGGTLATSGSPVRLWHLSATPYSEWSLNAPQVRLSIKEKMQMVWCLALTPDGRSLATGSGDGIVRFWDTATGSLQGSYDWEIGPVRALAIAPNGTAAAAGGSGKNNLVVWDLE